MILLLAVTEWHAAFFAALATVVVAVLKYRHPRKPKADGEPVAVRLENIETRLGGVESEMKSLRVEHREDMQEIRGYIMGR